MCVYSAEYDLFQIELSKNYGLTEWHDDLKKVMLKAGVENNPVVFLFSDTQVGLLNQSINQSISQTVNLDFLKWPK